MSFITYHGRSFKSLTDPSKIELVLEKYVDFSSFFISSPVLKMKIIHIAYHGGNELVITFATPMEEDRLTIYTITRGRYIDLDISIISRDDSPKICSARIEKLRIAADRREFARNSMQEMPPHIEKVSLPKFQESEDELKNSVLVKVMVKEYMKKLPDYSFKQFYLKGDKDLPPDVRFVMQTGISLIMLDTSRWEHFMQANQEYFSTVKMEMLQEELTSFFPKVAQTYKSFIIRPLEYQSLAGDKVTIAYMKIALEDSEIDLEELSAGDDFCEEMNNRIRRGNMVEYGVRGEVNNMSQSGACIYISDSAFQQSLKGHDAIMFDMKLRYEEPFRISASIIHAYAIDETTTRIGVKFKGSFFGPDLAKKVESWFKKYLNVDHPMEEDNIESL